MRERRVMQINEGDLIGITPARAGKTAGVDGLKARAEDHPRSCGKDRLYRPGMQMASGSPPLVRERPVPTFVVTISTRITPARAGKTQ